MLLILLSDSEIWQSSARACLQTAEPEKNGDDTQLDFGHSAFRVVQHISGSTTAVQGFAMCVSPRDIAKTPSVSDRLTESRSCRPRMAFGFGLPHLTGSRSQMAKIELRPRLKSLAGVWWAR